MPLQRELVRDDPTLCVLAHVSDARRILRGNNEDDIIELLESGYLLGWDIALAPGQAARELRLLPESVDAFLSTGRKHNFEFTWPRILLRGCSSQTVRSPTIALLLNCGATHVTNLIDAGQLKAAPAGDGPLYRRGPNGAAIVTNAAFVEFMKRRVL